MSTEFKGKTAAERKIRELRDKKLIEARRDLESISHVWRTNQASLNTIRSRIKHLSTELDKIHALFELEGEL